MNETKINVVACVSCDFRRFKGKVWHCNWYKLNIPLTVSHDGQYSKPRYCNVEFIKVGVIE